jgi:hypothetical protein
LNKGITNFLKQNLWNRKVVLFASIALALKLSVIYGILRYAPEPVTTLAVVASVKWLIIPSLILFWRAHVRKSSSHSRANFAGKNSFMVMK